MDQDISDADYDHAQRVWNRFAMQTMGDYHDLYLKWDVLQLAEVFETFRSFCVDKYGLDPAHFMTAPGLHWVPA